MPSAIFGAASESSNASFFNSAARYLRDWPANTAPAAAFGVAKEGCQEVVPMTPGNEPALNGHIFYGSVVNEPALNEPALYD